METKCLLDGLRDEAADLLGKNELRLVQMRQCLSLSCRSALPTPLCENHKDKMVWQTFWAKHHERKE